MDDMTPEQRHTNMQHIRANNTKPEVLLRKNLWKHGLRYRINWSELLGKPDIVLTKQKICIFCDGEYFHGKDWENGKREKVLSGNNPDYWTTKIEKNIVRDEEITAILQGLGWTVLRFWSRDILKNVDGCVNTILQTILELEISKSNS